MDTVSMYLYLKLNWDSNRFLPTESKDCMNSASYEYRKERGTVCAHGNADFLLENLSREDHKKFVN